MDPSFVVTDIEVVEASDPVCTFLKVVAALAVVYFVGEFLYRRHEAKKAKSDG